MNLEIFITCGLALLEMTFVFVGLLLLHSLRKMIGAAAFYMSVGLLLVFTQLVSATELKVILGFPGADFYIAPTVLFLPSLAALMIIYITEGTLATQRLIIGVMATLGLYIYLSHITATQCTWDGYAISQGPSADSLNFLLRQSKNTMIGSTLALTLDLFLIPIFFQRLRNFGARLFFCVLGALMLTQIIDTIVYTIAVYWGQDQLILHMFSSYIAKAFATIWLSVIAGIYLHRIEHEIPGEGRGALDIIFAFFGSYGQTQILQRSLQEWEGRYRMVIENASDIILVLDAEGNILDSNAAAVRIFKASGRESFIGQHFNDIFSDQDGKRIHLRSYANFAMNVAPGQRRQRLESLHARAKSYDGDLLEFDIAFSSMNIKDQPMLIIFGRDITEQSRLNRERERLQDQLSHAQRLESIGHLAGGVAHDFNNYIHAIQGHLDILLLMHDIEDETIAKHLNSVNEISDQAAHLTQQLLGFARKGKYRVEKLDLVPLAHDAIELFRPTSQKNIECRVLIDEAKDAYLVHGDAVQLTQVLLNILINAQDAMENKSDNLMIELELAPGRKFRKEFPTVENTEKTVDDYYCIRISDTGEGMDENTQKLIFDPFFTTKPTGKGTGMGLAMVYGTITNHSGLVSVKSREGEGTSFYIFLPINSKQD